MQSSTSPVASPPAQFLPAWAFSILFHFGMIVLLGVAVQQYPRGAAVEDGRAGGIVLKRASADRELDDGKKVVANDGEAIEQQPPDLLPALPSESSAANIATALPQAPAVSPHETADSVQPHGGQFPSGGGRRGAPGGGGDAQVSVFGVQGKGKKFVYLFDRSSSMAGAPLAAAKRQLVESLQSLESVHQFHVIFFNTRTQGLSITGGRRRIAHATDRNKQLAANFVGGIVADGGTDRLVALREAIDYAPDVIFFLTDADDPMPASELADIARANGRARAAICVIEFGRRAAPLPGNFLAELARQSSGQYGYVDTATLSH